MPKPIGMSVVITGALSGIGKAIALAQAAVKRFGKVDVWVNNAGVGAVGRFTDVPVEAHDQVIRTSGALILAHRQ